MKYIKQTIGAAIVSAALVLVSGCDTVNKLVSVNGQGVNNWFGGLMAQISPQQQTQLQQQSPQTLAVLQHNDQVAKQQQAAASGQPAPSSGQTASASGQSTPAASSGQTASASGTTPAADAPLPLKVDDIKAMAGAGIKPDAIIQAIKESKTTYSPDDIDAAQKITPALDPTVIACMKNPTA